MGAGKSACAGFLSEACRAYFDKVLIIDADIEAKRLMLADLSIKKKLADVFGTPFVRDGMIDFPKLGTLVFSNREHLLTLNRIVHPPLVAKLKELVFSGAACSICDAALIPLWRVEAWFDATVWVRASFEKRYERLSDKSLIAREELVARMHLQQTLFEEPEAGPWAVIENDGTLNELRKRTVSFLKHTCMEKDCL